MPEPVEFDVAGYSVTFKPGNPITLCEITTNGVPSFAYGLGVRKHGDIYNRVRGMQQALASAIKGVPKDDRQLIWDEFFRIYPREAPEEMLETEVLKRKAIEHLNEAGAFLRKLARIESQSL